MKTYEYTRLTNEDLARLCTRENIDHGSVNEVVTAIGADIKTRGDAALRDLTEKFDRATLDDFLVPEASFVEAEKILSPEWKAALDIAWGNVEAFHRAQVRAKEPVLQTTPGVRCWREARPIERVGLYIPAGTAPLFSAVYMMAIPAKLAGVHEIILCSPPKGDAGIAPEILYTARKAGITRVFQVGGAQAIFAMAYGTAQIPKVDKVCGPGNPYVTAAKMQVSSQVSIDMPASATEVLVIADDSAPDSYIAADLLAQAEHGADSQVVLLTWEAGKIERVLLEVERQLSSLPRGQYIRPTLEKSFAVLTQNREQALAFSNLYAPEHLMLEFDGWEEVLPQVQHAGSVFGGIYTPEPFGDYSSGTNHVLPTYGFARSMSGLCVESFQKWMTFQSATREGLQKLGPPTEILARAEELTAHANAVTIRLNSFQ